MAADDMADTILSMDLVSDPYISECGILDISYEPKFIVTSGYKELKQKFSESTCIGFRICGPKGVGKSFAVLALWHELRSSRPCIVITSRSFCLTSFVTHLMELCEKWASKLFIRYNYYAYVL